MQPATVRQQAEVTKVRASVPVPAASAASKAVRCLCTEDSLKEASHAENSKEIVAINVSMLNVFENDAVVDIDALKAVGLISNPRDGVKILGEGDLERKLTVKVNFYSKTAQEKIEAAGGKAEVI